MKLLAAAAGLLVLASCYSPGHNRYVVPEDVHAHTIVTADGDVIGPPARGWLFLLDYDGVYRMTAKGGQVFVEYTFIGQDETLPQALDEDGRAFPLEVVTQPEGYTVAVSIPLSYAEAKASEGIVLSVRTQKARNREGVTVSEPRTEPAVRAVYVQGFLRRLDEVLAGS